MSLERKLGFLNRFKTAFTSSCAAYSLAISLALGTTFYGCEKGDEPGEGNQQSGNQRYACQMNECAPDPNGPYSAADCDNACEATICTPTHNLETICDDNIDNDCDNLTDSYDLDCPCLEPPCEVWTAIDNKGKSSSIAVDDSGNVYVAGISHNGTNNDYKIIKYDSNGHTVWDIVYDSGDDDVSSDIAVDGSGNVYVTGYSRNGTSMNDYRTIKYDSAGKVIWNVIYNNEFGEFGHADEASSIAVDGSGNVCVTGTSIRAYNFTITTIKYDSNGNTVWIKSYKTDYNTTGFTDTWGNGIATDNLGNVYVTGGSQNSIGTHSVSRTIKYDSNGNILWDVIYDRGEGVGIAEGSNGITVGSSGNVYVTGQSHNNETGYDESRTIKYDSNGNILWDKVDIDGKGGSDIAIDGSENAYIIGNSLYEYRIIKYDSNGNTLWTKVATDELGVSIHGKGIALDDSNNLYTIGSKTASFGFRTIKFRQQ